MSFRVHASCCLVGIVWEHVKILWDTFLSSMMAAPMSLLACRKHDAYAVDHCGFACRCWRGDDDHFGEAEGEVHPDASDDSFFGTEAFFA